MLLLFNSKKSTRAAHRKICEVYGKKVISLSTCGYWFKRFRSGNIDTDNKPYKKRQQKFTNDELEALLEENPCRTQKEFGRILGVNQKTISRCLRKIGIVRKRLI